MQQQLSKFDFDKLTDESAASIRKIGGVEDFSLGIILGTGASEIQRLAASTDKNSVSIPYDRITPPLPVKVIPGQVPNVLVLKHILPDGGSAVIFGARPHTYRFSDEDENHSFDKRALHVGYIPAVISHLTENAGDKAAIITTDAIGGNVHGLKQGYVLMPGDIGVITGYNTVSRPAYTGQVIGSPFLDRREMMDEDTFFLIKKSGRMHGIPLYPGDTYVYHGPDFETDIEDIYLVLLGMPYVGMTGIEAETWFTLRRKHRKPLRNLHLGIVSDNTLPRPERIKTFLDGVLPEYPFADYLNRIYQLSRDFPYEETTHARNVAAVEAVTPNIAKLLHTYVGFLYGARDAKYKEGSALFRY